MVGMVSSTKSSDFSSRVDIIYIYQIWWMPLNKQKILLKDERKLAWWTYFWCDPLFYYADWVEKPGLFCLIGATLICLTLGVSEFIS